MIPLSPTLRGALTALAVLLSSPLPARAQGGAAEALSALSAGDSVRLRTGAGRDVHGTLVASGADSVRLQTAAGPAAVATGEVTEAWVWARSARRGALDLGVKGLAAGAVLGGLAEMVDGPDGDLNAGHAAAIVVGMGAVWAGGGAILGNRFAWWTRVYKGGFDELRAATPERPRRSALTLTGGYSKLTGDGGSTGGLEMAASFLGEWHLGGRPGGRRAFLSVGPELGFATPGDTPPLPHRNYLPTCDPVCRDTLTYPRRYGAMVARGLVRLGVEDGALRGYAVAGGGLHQWYTHAANDTSDGAPLPSADDHSALGGTFGLGAQYRTGLRDALGIEVRRNVVRTRETDFADGYWSVAATYTRTW